MGDSEDKGETRKSCLRSGGSVKEALRNSPVLRPPEKAQRIGEPMDAPKGIEIGPQSSEVGASENLFDSGLAGRAGEDGAVFGEGLGSKGQVPLLPGKGPPGFGGAFFGAASPEKGMVGGWMGAGPYPAQGGGFAELLQEIRAGNQDVDAKFGVISSQFATLHIEIAQIKSEVVTQVQFGELQSRVSKLESSAGVAGGTGVEALTMQLDRLDPARKCLAIHGIVDANLDARTKHLEKLFSDVSGCPSPVYFDHIHKGKAGERSVTKVSLVEFRCNADREKAFQLTKDLEFKDGSGAKLGCKRARTNLQKQRNDALVGAERALKEKLGASADVKIDWENRRVVSKGEPAFEQKRGEVSGVYLAKFAALVG